MYGAVPESEDTPLFQAEGAPKKAFVTAAVTAVGLLFLVAATSSSTQNAAIEPSMAAVVEGTAAAAGVAAASESVVAFSVGQFDLVYNMFSLAVAAMGSATVFFFFQFSLVDVQYRTAMVITGMVTLIAFYHYLRIFNSWNEAYLSRDGQVTATGVPFNDAYRYVDWLLTVPLLLSELILVMGLDAKETANRCFTLGSLAALMVILGYPGEISDDSGTRWIFWGLAMIPFLIIVYTLYVGLSHAVESQPQEARGLVQLARALTVVSWCFYPVVFLFPVFGFTGATSRVAVQVGYSVADVIAKPGMGLVCWMIASAKSQQGAK